ncbi:hypothetical protein PROFUN_08635 [Planoprotostelium fungivorum]|uniref:SET domain-containing protein n=1 Tax=Planoprotostelium fungivorum TaxID=1890364 RepID=A0A2P6NJ32_9EUKA|nr:hypothetical protein PROFUN_08635 [Planoprotostelium fungivorum]
MTAPVLNAVDSHNLPFRFQPYRLPPQLFLFSFFWGGKPYPAAGRGSIHSGCIHRDRRSSQSDQDETYIQLNFQRACERQPHSNMDPVKPHWQRPSHPDLILAKKGDDPKSFSASSHSLVDLPTGSTFTKLTFPPLTLVESPSYATLQTGRDQHVLLNSDIMFANHSCSPSLEFDVGQMEVRVSRDRDMKKGDGLTFFYPSTEWNMSQPLC